MSEKIIVPTLGESVTEATVSKWLKSQGEQVLADEPIVELETDKVNVEVPAPSNGVLESISVKEGETVNVGSPLGVINDLIQKKTENIKEVKSYSPPQKKIQIKKNTQKSPQIFDEEHKTRATDHAEEEPLILETVHEEKEIKSSFKKSISKNPTISPAAKKMATEAKIDVSNIQG